MFGYVNVYKPELKMKDFYQYKAYYCGLCKILKNKYGRFGQMTLSYDMTFLIVLLTSLYETKTEKLQNRCLVHPVKRHDTLINEITDYVADMNIALTYHHLLDDWQDEMKVTGLAGAGALKRAYKQIEKKYPRQCSTIKDSLARLQKCEKGKETNIDLVAGCFGDLMGEIFLYKEDQWQTTLRRMGFFLGKYIYILDAYDDLEKDDKNDSYNPFYYTKDREGYEEEIQQYLIMMMAECTGEFEKLPCIWNADILHNILYEGVWTRLEIIQKERSKRKEQCNDNKSVQDT